MHPLNTAHPPRYAARYQRPPVARLLERLGGKPFRGGRRRVARLGYPVTSKAASAAMFTRSLSVEPSEAIWTGFDKPTSIGPITVAPPSSSASWSRCRRSGTPA